MRLKLWYKSTRNTFRVLEPLSCISFANLQESVGEFSEVIEIILISDRCS